MVVVHVSSPPPHPEQAPLTAQHQPPAVLRAGKPREWGGVGRSGDGSRGGWGRTAATYVALLKRVGVIPAVVQQSLPRVPRVAEKAEIDVGICSRAFEFPRAHRHTVPGHWQAERGTPLAGGPLLPSSGLAAPHF